LLWDAPTSDGGRSITQYVLDLRHSVDNFVGQRLITVVTTMATDNSYLFDFANSSIVNGITYTANLFAVSDNAGEGVDGVQSALLSKVPFASPIIDSDVTIKEDNLLKFKVQPNGRPILRVAVLATDEDGASSTETLFIERDVSQDYAGIVTGTIEIPVQFDNFSTAISKYLILVFTQDRTTLLNTFTEM
jgi:hypothetical protein